MNQLLLSREKLIFELIIKEVTLSTFQEQLPKMTTLYEKVAANAGFNLGNFNCKLSLLF